MEQNVKIDGEKRIETGKTFQMVGAETTNARR